MSFKMWWDKYAVGFLVRAEWVQEVARDAFIAGQKYERSLASKRKPKET
jgi:hypothetical protein